MGVIFLETSSIVLKVGGLRDVQGRREIEHNLIQIDGVRHVSVSVPTREINVEFDPRVIRKEYLERTLDSLGYSPYVFSND